ncbi:MAG: translation initiation factor IF-2 [Campylobacteraceae bacterium]|jgi:translation initiation factor IF-2|nr:translation initiation factor IF-2 [Campylobacteraceae bacterium]
MVEKVKIAEIAKEVGATNKTIIEKALELGLDAKAPASAITVEEADRLVNYILSGVDNAPLKKEPQPQPKKAESKPKMEPKVQTSQKSLQKVEQSPKHEQVSQPKPKEYPKSTVHVKEIKTVVKPVIETEQIPTPNVQTVASESLAEVTLKQRRGLVFVKKKRAEEPAPSETNDVKKSVKPTPSLEAMFANMNSSMQQLSEMRKKNKKIKKNIATKKDEGAKIDLLLDRDLGESSYDIEDDMVILPDLTINLETKKFEEERRKAPNPTQVKTVKYNPFLEQGIQRKSFKKHRKRVEEKNEESVKTIEIPEDVRVYEFADTINKQPAEIIKVLFTLGVMVTKNDFLDKDAIEILAEEFGIEVNVVNKQEEFDYVKAYDEEASKNLEERAPVITIMGHVDHGKTSLLDYIRESHVASGEAGGITQHVGAYAVEQHGKKITFIDTPGHEAFTEMRARGAQVTDIVIIVVAADDGVKPQTIEAISHARAAKVPMIIAVNKIDKPSANPDQVKSQLADMNILPVDWGGEYEFVNVSAKTGEGIEHLLDVILLQSELMELKADASRDAKATVIESSMEKGRGPVATIIVRNGTLRVGNTVVAGVAYGKVRALLNAAGQNIEAIHPGEPGVIVGLSEVPLAGETVVKVENDKIAREYANKKAEYLRQKELSKSTKVTIDELGAMIAEGELKVLPVIVKADVGGSLEAIKGSLEKLRNEETKINIIHSGIGGISESDISLANASQNCIILGFNVRPTGAVKEKAKTLSVEIKTYNIIYNLIDDVKGLLSGLMSPIIHEENLGQAHIREVFVVPKIGAIAGCMVTEGVINRGAKVRVIRDGIVIYEGVISSLKRFKDDAKEVAKGFECGIGIENFNDIKVGDFIESFKYVEEQAAL